MRRSLVSAFMLVVSASAFGQSGPKPAPTVRAIRATEPLRVDGKLDEAIYRSTPPITDFVQQEPDEYQPSTTNATAISFTPTRSAGLPTAR